MTMMTLHLATTTEGCLGWVQYYVAYDSDVCIADTHRETIAMQ